MEMEGWHTSSTRWHQPYTFRCSEFERYHRWSAYNWTHRAEPVAILLCRNLILLLACYTTQSGHYLLPWTHTHTYIRTPCMFKKKTFTCKCIQHDWYKFGLQNLSNNAACIAHTVWMVDTWLGRCQTRILLVKRGPATVSTEVISRSNNTCMLLCDVLACRHHVPDQRWGRRSRTLARGRDRCAACQTLARNTRTKTETTNTFTPHTQ